MISAFHTIPSLPHYFSNNDDLNALFQVDVSITPGTHASEVAGTLSHIKYKPKNISILPIKIHFPPILFFLTTPLEGREWSENLSDFVSNLIHVPYTPFDHLNIMMLQLAKYFIPSVNKQLADKERVAAALENSHLIEVVNQCLATRK